MGLLKIRVEKIMISEIGFVFLIWLAIDIYIYLLTLIIRVDDSLRYDRGVKKRDLFDQVQDEMDVYNDDEDLLIDDFI